jgi:hypothetical protein
LGSGPTIEIASTCSSIKAIILEAPMASVFLCLIKHPSWNYTGEDDDLYNNIKKIGQVSCPIFIMHGKNDEVIACCHS